jgi:hypothetical protein
VGLQLTTEPVTVSQRHSDLDQAIWRDVCLVEWPERLGDQLADEAGKLESRGHHHFAKFGKLLEVQSVILYHLHAMSIVVSRFGPYICLYHLITYIILYHGCI